MGRREKRAKGQVEAEPSVTRGNGVLRMSVAGLLFLCVSIGWSADALAACDDDAPQRNALLSLSKKPSSLR